MDYKTAMNKIKEMIKRENDLRKELVSSEN